MVHYVFVCGVFVVLYEIFAFQNSLYSKLNKHDDDQLYQIMYHVSNQYCRGEIHTFTKRFVPVLFSVRVSTNLNNHLKYRLANHWCWQTYAKPDIPGSEITIFSGNWEEPQSILPWYMYTKWSIWATSNKVMSKFLILFEKNWNQCLVSGLNQMNICTVSTVTVSR